MKKILAIIGSEKPVDSSITANLAQNLIDKIANRIDEVDFEIISLGEQNLMICKGCRSCSKTGKCILSDKLDSIIEKAKSSDLIILGSPVHISHVSATYKNFLDRLHVLMHTFEFLGKPFVSIVSTNGSGEDDTVKYINHTALLLGMIKLGTVIKFNNEIFDERKSNRISEELVKMFTNKSKLKPTFKNSLYFWSMKKIIRDNKQYFEYEDKIWNTRGWYNLSYKKVFNNMNSQASADSKD
jgi:multimeric flavodoxin WrbA